MTEIVLLFPAPSVHFNSFNQNMKRKLKENLAKKVFSSVQPYTLSILSLVFLKVLCVRLVITYHKKLNKMCVYSSAMSREIVCLQFITKK